MWYINVESLHAKNYSKPTWSALWQFLTQATFRDSAFDGFFSEIPDPAIEGQLEEYH